MFSSSPSGEWSSSAYRDLELLLDATRKALAVDSASAAIHVGFWRPETAQVAELARRWRGALLLSDAAIGALPPPLCVSDAPVGRVGGISFRVALDGFGYQVTDPGSKSSVPHVAQTSLTDYMGSSQEKFSGWVKYFVALKPSWVPVLQAACIWDEASYEQNEISLSIDARAELAIERFRAAVGAGVNRLNLLDNLHACPNWFLDDKLKFLDLKNRMRKVCDVHNFVTIRDLTTKGYSGLLRLQHVGEGTVHHLAANLYEAFVNADALRRESRPELEVGDPHSFKTILDGFESVASEFAHRERVVWVARLGVGCNQQTLQAIADDLGVTRERVRQIESKILMRARHHPFWKQLATRVRGHLNDRRSALLLNGMPAVDPWFSGVEALKEPLREVFHEFLNDEFAIIDIHGNPVLTMFSVAQWEGAIRAAKALLRDLAEARATEEQARVQVGALISGVGEELRDDLWFEVRDTAIWALNGSGERTIVGFGFTAEAVVTAVLESAGHPLHYQEIYRRSKQFVEKEHDERSLHNAARNVALLYGRGIYGLRSHCPFTDEELALIGAEVEDIVAGGEPTKQWHTSELLDELLERGLDFEGELTKYIVNIALSDSKMLSNMRRMVWGYKSAWQPGASSRLDMRQAIMALLETSGGPLSTLEIRDLLKSDRGVNSHFQIHPTGNLVRVGPGLWGLSERDIKVRDPDLLLEKLASRLRATQEGIHSSEVACLLGDVCEKDIQALLGLLHLKGMRRDRWQYIYLSTWESARRVTPSQAVEQALDCFPAGASIDAIRTEANRLTKRQLKATQVSSLLLHIETAVFDHQSGLWRKDPDGSARSQDDEIEEESTG